MELSFTTRPLGDAVVLGVVGEIDLATVPRLRSRVIALVEEGYRSLVVDLAGVDFIDSAGLGVLVGARRRARAAGGDLTLVVPDGPVRELFTTTGLATLFAIGDSADDLRCPSGR